MQPSRVEHVSCLALEVAMQHRQLSTMVFNDGREFPQRWTTVNYPDPLPFKVVKSPVQKTKLDPDGWRPMTQYSVRQGPGGHSEIIFSGKFVVKQNNAGYHWRIESYDPPPSKVYMSNTSLPPVANVKNQALNKLKGQAVNVVMMLKDRKETLKGLNDRLKWLVASVGAARSGNLIKSANHLKRFWRSRTPGVVNKYRAANDKVGKPLANMWLELNFLHMQVIADANGLMKELGEELPVKGGFLHGRSGKDNGESDIIKISPYSTNGWGTYEFNRVQKFVVYAQVSAKPDIEFLTTASRLGLTNAPYVLWDSVPLSFVLDWVLPIGNYLNAWDATLGMKFKGAHYGIIKSQELKLISVTEPQGEVLQIGTVSVQDPKQFTRELTDWKPEMPQVQNPLSGLAWKVATTAALLANVVKRSQNKPR